MTEKQKFDEEMQKMVMQNELHQKSVKDQEDSLAKQKVRNVIIISKVNLSFNWLKIGYHQDSEWFNSQ